MKKRNNAFASPANAPLTFQALQAADFPLKNRNKLTRSQSNTQDQAMGRSSGGGGRASSNEADFAHAGTNMAGGVANTRICINNSVPASLFTAMATSTQLPDTEEPHSSSKAELSSSLLPADMGMLRPTAAQRLPQHGLPSGTHIRRRPRSVARPGAGSHGTRHAAAAAANITPAAAGATATHNSNNNNGGSSPSGFGSPQQIFIAPPSKGLPYGGGGGDALARSVYMSPELLSLSPAPTSDEMGASSSATAASASAAAVTATLAQGMKPATRASREAKPLKYVRRAAPSPAPSRPVRANRRRPLPNTTALTKASSPTEHALAAEGVDEWFDADVVPARGSTTANHAAIEHSARDAEDEGRDGRGSYMAEKRKAEPRLGSGRRLAALPNVPAGASQMPSSASETLDFYLKLCAEVGEEPSAEWVSALEDAVKDGNAGAAGGMRKARKEAAVSDEGKSATAAGASRRVKSPGAGARSTKRSSSSGVGGGRTPPAAPSTSTLAPGGGQRPPLTRASKAALAGPATVEEEVRLYCKAHLYPCLMKIGTIERYRKDLTEAFTDFTRACDALPSTEVEAKALLAAHEATVAAASAGGRHGATKSGRGGGSTSPAPGTALNSGSHRHGGHSNINSPSAASLSVPAGAAGRAHEDVSALTQLASRMTSDLARLQERATMLLVTLGGFSKEMRRPLGTVPAKEDTHHASQQASSSSIGSGVEASKEALSVPQGFVKRLAKEEVKAAQLLETIRSEVEAALAAKPCVSVQDSSMFKTPLLYSPNAHPSHSPHLRVRSGESGGALTLSHRSGPHPMHTPRGGAHASPEMSLSSPSPIGARRQSAHNTNTSTALSGRQRTGRGAGKPVRQASFAPVVRVCVPAPSLSSSFQRASRRSSVHSDSVRVGATPNTSSREYTSQLSSSELKPGSGSGGGGGGGVGQNGTVLLVVSCGEPVSGGGGAFSRRASAESLSSAASQTPTAHQGGAGGRGDRATKAVGAGRSRSASAGAGKRRGGAASGVKRSGSVKAGGARAATGGSVSSSTNATNALPLRSSLRTSAEFGENEIAKAREAASTAIEPSSASGLAGTTALKSTGTFGSARFALPSRDDLDEAKTIWEAVSALARRSGSSSGFSSPHRKPSDSSTGSHDAPTATAAPSPEKLEKDVRPFTADAFTAALATFDRAANDVVPPRASSETAPQRGDIAKVLQGTTGEQYTVSSPPPNASLRSATMAYEGGAVPSSILLGNASSPFISQQALPHRPLHGIDSAGTNSIVCSPVDLPAMMVGGGESPNIASISGNDTQESTLVTDELSHTLANPVSVTATTTTTTAGTSEPPSAERLRKVRTAAAREMRGRSQSILQVAPPNEKSVVAVRLIMAYFRRFRARKQLATRLAQHRKEEESEALAQQRRVSEQRVGQFLWSLVQRQRTRRAVAAHKREVQLQAMANTAAAAVQDAKANSAAAKASAGKALTSRERLQLAKEQREVMRRGDSATARQAASSASTHPTSAASESRASLSPLIAIVPELALADNGISTSMIANYNRDGDSFEVAVLHRLLLAPKALLYTVRAAIESYPMRPPMAYAKPHEDIRRGEASISPERASQTPDRDDADLVADSTKRCGSIACASPEQTEKDRHDGVFRVPFSCLRPYILYYAELAAAAQSRVSDSVKRGVEPTTAAATRAGGKPPRSRVSTPPPQDVDARSSSAPPLLHVPRSVRYDSYVDVDELRHDVPVVKPFPRPFEVWGSSHNLVRRIFSAAAMYAWKLIFSHTPHDDAKQRQLRSRDEQAQRLERVDQRNRMILACYAVHSEREWLREASKDLSFVGQIFNPKRSMDPNDPDLDRHCRETYEFVEDFLYQCFPTVTSLDEVPSFLVGAGLFFVFKEVFQWRADGPDASVVMKQVPGWALTTDQLTEPRRIVQTQREAFLEGNPNVALFCEGGAHRKGADSHSWLVASGGGGGVGTGGASSSSVAGVLQQPVDVYLTGFQHFEVLRFEQLCLLHRLARWIYEQRPEAEPKVSNVFSPLSPQQSMEVTTSLMQSSVTALNGAAAAAAQFLSRRTDDAGKTVSSVGADEGSDKGVMSAGESSGTSPAHPALKTHDVADGKRRFSDTPGTDELHMLHASVSGTSLMHDRLAESTRVGGSGFANNVLGGGPARHQKQLTPAEKQQDAEEAKKEQQVMPVKLVAIPAAVLQTVKQQQQQPQQQQGRAAGSTFVTPSRGSGASADRRSLCDYEHEQYIKQRQHKLSLLVSRYLESTGANSSKATRGEKASKRSAVETEKTTLSGSEFMMVYPKNFLVDLSEKLTYELLGLRLHLGVCEELDAI